MKEIFNTYFHYFIHPFLAQRNLAQNRILGAEKNDERPEVISFLCLSWLLACVKAFYSLIAIYIGLKSWNWVTKSEGTLERILGPEISTGNKFLVFYVLLELVLFPFSAFIFVKFWSIIIHFFVALYDIDLKNPDETVEEVVSAPLTSHLFFLVPIFGQMAKHLSSLVFIFAGLRSNLKMSIMQSVIVVLSPLFLIFFAILVIGLYVLLIFAAL